MAIDKKKAVENIRNADSPEEAGKELSKYIEQLNAESGSKFGKSDQDIKRQGQYNQMLSETAAVLGNINDMYKYANEARKAQILQDQEITEALKKHEKDINTLTVEELKSLSSISKEKREQLKLFLEEKEMAKARLKYSEANKNLFDDITGSIGMNIKMENTFLGKVTAVGKQLAMNGKEGSDARKQFARDLMEALHPMKMLYGLMTKIAEASIKVAMDFDKARAQLAAATGAGYKFAGGMFNAQRSTRLFGVTMDDAVKATAALNENTAIFAKMNKESRSQLTQTTAMLGRLGVDGNMAAETFQFMNLVLGKTAEQTQDFQKRLAMMGNQIGIPPQKMTKDFNAALPTLAVYGEKAVKVFSNLAAAAKAAGVETGTLLNIAKQYDTFAGAAEGAGKLNALLGTQLSTTQMLMMTEDQRIETLIESVQAQGVAFKDMDRFTQKAIMHAAGITDINEANKIFGMSVTAYRENQREMARSAEVQKKFEDAVAATVPVMEKLKLLAGEFIVSIQPFLNTIGEFAEKATKALQLMSAEEKESWANTIMVGTAIGALITMFTGIAMAAAPVVASMKMVGAASAIVTATSGPAAAGLTSLSGGMAAAVGPAAIFTLKAIALAAAIAGIGYAISAVIEAWSNWSLGEQANELKEAELATDALRSIDSLSGAGFDNASVKIKEIVGELTKLGQSNDIMVKTRSTIENLALVSAGKAKDTMTGGIVTASPNMSTSVQNVFSGMKMVLQVGKDEIEGTIIEMVTPTIESIVTK